MKERYCPICESALKHEDYKQISQNNSQEYWENNSLAIPCCECFVLLNELDSDGDFTIKYPKERGMVWRILKNLYKFGLITEDKRDSKMKDFVTFDERFKQNRNMFHFLI